MPRFGFGAARHERARLRMVFQNGQRFRPTDGAEARLLYDRIGYAV